MDKSLDIFNIVAALIASLSIATTLYSSISERINQIRKLRKLKEDVFEIVLESSNIKTLGKYLDHEIGQLTISDYVENKDINKRIDILLNRLTQFIGTDDEINKESKEQETFTEKRESKEQFKDFPYLGKLGPEFDKIISELYTGEPWNALARLRRHIEITLKEIAQKHNIPVEKMHSMTYMIDFLKHNKIIPIDVARNLKYPIHVSNRAVHGEDLKQGEAEEAIYHAAIALDRIINNDKQQT